MGRNYIALAVPVFFALIGLELLAARRRGRSLYRLGDALSDLACGITQQVGYVFMGGAILAGYAHVFERLRLVSFPDGSGWPWLIAFVGVDFLYYWWHRLSHEVNVLWAVHVVHHQSEDYNLAVALRQALLSGWTTLPFYLPLALVGVPPLVWVAVNSFSTLYQFWIHTELVGTLGRAELVLNTPSQHRVHHAINPRYLDRNYGATLCVWDRLFGTYEPEAEPPVYGITKPLRSYNPLWAQVHYFVELAALSRRAPRFADKLRVWWKGPAWRPEGLPAPAPAPVNRATVTKYDPRPRGRLAWYVLAQFAAAVACTFVVMMWHAVIPRPALVAAAGLIFATLVACGALVEDKRWAVPVEAARLAVAVGALVALPSLFPG